MPCSDPGGPSVDDFTLQQKKLNRVTALLCSLCRELENEGVFNKYATPAHEKWWRKHKKEDDKRRVMTAAKAAAQLKLVHALDKLTDDEVALLGLSDSLKQIRKSARSQRKGKV